MEDRLDAELAVGRHHEVVGALHALTAQHPYRERIWSQLVVALYRSARQADALATYRRVRSILVEGLGIEPGPELQRLERDILGQARELERPPPTTHPHGAQRLMTSPDDSIPLPAPLAEGAHSGVLVGRGRGLAVLRRALDGAWAGRFGAVLVAGPLGIGKTSLVASFAREAHSSGAVVAFGRADEGAAIPFQAVGEGHGEREVAGEAQADRPDSRTAAFGVGLAREPTEPRRHRAGAAAGERTELGADAGATDNLLPNFDPSIPNSEGT